MKIAIELSETQERRLAEIALVGQGGGAAYPRKEPGASHLP